MSLMIPGVSGRCERGEKEGENTAKKKTATVRVTVLCRKGNGYDIAKPPSQKTYSSDFYCDS